MLRPPQRTTHRNWSRCSATPTHGRRMARTETAQCRAAADRSARSWLPVLRVLRLVPTGAICCSPRLRRVPARPESPHRLQTPPTSLPAPHRPRPRPEPTHPGQPSRPVRITGAQNAGRSNASAGCFLATSNALQPRAKGRPGRDPFQFGAEEFLHGLALQRRTRGDLVADFLRDAPDGDLYRHACIMPAVTACSKQLALCIGTRLGLSRSCLPRCGRESPPWLPTTTPRQGAVARKPSAHPQRLRGDTPAGLRLAVQVQAGRPSGRGTRPWCDRTDSKVRMESNRSPGQIKPCCLPGSPTPDTAAGSPPAGASTRPAPRSADRPPGCPGHASLAAPSATLTPAKSEIPGRSQAVCGRRPAPASRPAPGTPLDRACHALRCIPPRTPPWSPRPQALTHCRSTLAGTHENGGHCNRASPSRARGLHAPRVTSGVSEHATRNSRIPSIWETLRTQADPPRYATNSRMTSPPTSVRRNCRP